MSLVRFRLWASCLLRQVNKSDGALAQSVEHLTFNQVVRGSNPRCFIKEFRENVENKHAMKRQSPRDIEGELLFFCYANFFVNVLWDNLEKCNPIKPKTVIK